MALIWDLRHSSETKTKICHGAGNLEGRLNKYVVLENDKYYEKLQCKEKICDFLGR